MRMEPQRRPTKTRPGLGIAVLALAWALAGMGTAADSGLKVAVAANFRAPFAALGADFTKAAGVELVPVFGASGLLATQIRQGAPFDAFLSADLARPQALVDDGLAAGPVRLYARGRVALWTPGRPAAPNALSLGRIALPNPKLAPYGQAAVECLQALQLWRPHRDSLVFGSNVAQVSHFLSSGAVTSGFVALGQLQALAVPAKHYWVCPEHSHKPIDQGAVLLRGRASGRAAAFLDFMTGPSVQERLAELGYAPVADRRQASLAGLDHAPKAGLGPAFDANSGRASDAAPSYALDAVWGALPDG